MKYDDQTMVDYCLEQGWQIFYEEWTDAIGHLPCDSLGSWVYVVRDSNEFIRGHSQLSRMAATRNAYENACQQHQKLLAPVNAYITQLENVLREFATDTNGYSEQVPDSVCTNRETGKHHVRIMCTYCHEGWWNDESETHDLYCPVRLARELLENES